MPRIVVIGGSAAGMMAAVSAARQSAEAEVTVISADEIPYRRPAIPALIAGYICDAAGARIFSPDTLNRYGIKLMSPARAIAIDVKGKTVSVESDGRKQNVPYDSAVIAVGGHPMIPRIPGANKPGVCTFTTYEGAREIVERSASADSAVVVGAGFIALEVAEALMHKGLTVYFNVRSRVLRRLTEPDVSEYLAKQFERRGLKMLTGEAISEIGGSEAVEYVVHKGKKIPTTLVIMGTGVKPNVELAKEAGIELGSTGAIKVDSSMRTSAPDIYAAGDCAESPDLGTGQNVYSPVGSIGALAGAIAGRNAAGANIKTKGFLRAQADEILGLQIFSIGHSTTTAKDANLDVKVHDVPAPEGISEADIRNYPAIVKLLTASRGKIVGAQMVSHRHGSQFAWQLHRAVLTTEKRKEFLKRWTAPRHKFVQAMLQGSSLELVVERVGETNALRWEASPEQAP